MAKSRQTQTKHAETSDVQNFEQALSDLERMIEKLEKGGLTLEASLETYTQGVALAKQCQNTLKQAEQKVLKLMQNDNLVPLDTISNDESL